MKRLYKPVQLSVWGHVFWSPQSQRQLKHQSGFIRNLMAYLLSTKLMANRSSQLLNENV